MGKLENSAAEQGRCGRTEEGRHQRRLLRIPSNRSRVSDLAALPAGIRAAAVQVEFRGAALVSVCPYLSSRLSGTLSILRPGSIFRP